MSSITATWHLTSSVPNAKGVAIDLLTQAFLSDPVWQNITHDPSVRHSTALYVFDRRLWNAGHKSLVLVGSPDGQIGCNFKIGERDYTNWTPSSANTSTSHEDSGVDVGVNGTKQTPPTPTADQILAHVIISPPEDAGMKMDLWTRFRMGWWQVRWRFGSEINNNFNELLATMMPHLQQSIAEDPEARHGAWSLEAMGVDTSIQGKGIGTKAMKSLLDIIDEDGRAAIVMTQKHRNVTFYEKLGFNIIGYKQLPCNGAMVDNWVMKRPGKKTSQQASEVPQ